MAESGSKPPEGFPDLTLPERTVPVPPVPQTPPLKELPEQRAPDPPVPLGPVTQATRAAPDDPVRPALQPGSRVFAPWTASTLFAGTVRRMAGTEALVRFDELGQSGWVQQSQVMPLELDEGTKVVARRGRGSQYFPATVVAMRGEEVLVCFDDDGQDEEWTTAAALCLPGDPVGPDARPPPALAREFDRETWRWIGWFAFLVFIVLARLGCR